MLIKNNLIYSEGRYCGNYTSKSFPLAKKKNIVFNSTYLCLRNRVNGSGHHEIKMLYFNIILA